MFPYKSRLRWLIASPPDHLLTAIAHDANLSSHPLVAARAGQMRRYLALRVLVTALLYAGLVGTLVSALAQLAPATSLLARAFAGFAAIAGALTGLLTLTYLGLSRLVAQCQMDILGHYLIGMPHSE